MLWFTLHSDPILVTAEKVPNCMTERLQSKECTEIEILFILTLLGTRVL
jgi:hypothetical protein